MASIFESARLNFRDQPDFLHSTLGQALQNPFGATTLQANTLWIALSASFGSMLLVTILFSLVRPHNTVVYAPKSKHADEKHRPPKISSAPLAWVAPVTRTKEETLIEKIGLDAAIFLRFLKMCRNMFATLALFGCLILVPVHVTTTRSQLAGQPPAAGADSVTSALISITPLNVTGPALWSHVVASYVIDLVVMLFLWLNYRTIAKLKRSYFQNKEYQQSLHARSIWLTDIPRKDQSDEGILRICDTVTSTPSLPHATIARQVKGLPDKIKEHEEAVRELESVLAKYLKNPDHLPANRPMMKPIGGADRRNLPGKVDAIQYLTKRVENLEIQVRDMRQSIDKKSPEQYGFATYERIEDAHVVAFEGRKKKPAGTRIRLAPRPHDLIWENLNLSKKSRARKRMVFSFWILILTLIYIVPNALIAAFLSNLGNLAAVWPAFKNTYEADRGLWQFVQAVLSPALLSLIYLMLPIIFRRWSQNAGDLTKTDRERHVIQKLYVFFVFNNLIVFSLFSTVFGFVTKVLGATETGTDAWKAIRDLDIANLLLQALCPVSNFWLIWLIQRNLGAAIDLAQLVNLVYKWFMRTFMAPTPRQAIEWTAPPPFDYASYYNWFLFYVTVALAFATVQPLVMLVTFVYFLIDTWLKRYLLLYIFVTKTESGGQFWNLIFNRILFATFMANCVAALVIKGCWGQWGANVGGNTPAYVMMGSMIPLPLMLLAFKIYCEKAFGNQTRYYTTQRTNVEAGSVNPSYRTNERIGKKFGHPALYKKLMRPMVHAKAQHMLSKIYSGRIDHEYDGAGDADIEMTQMSTDTKKLFEVIPETALDFANFKNRADFAGHGGDGELYGKPEDLASERSKTPMSFASDDELSRAGTPQPMPARRHHHQASRSQTQDSVPLYNYNNDSQRSLLAAAGPGGYAPVQSHQTYEQYPQQQPGGYGPAQGHHTSEQYPQQQPGVMRMDAWRTAGSGYVGVAGQPEEEDIAYEAYRPPAQQHTSYRGYRG